MQRVPAEAADSPHDAEEGPELSPKGHQLGLGRHQQHQYYTQQRLEQEQQQKQQEQQQKQQEEQERQTLQQSAETDHQSEQPDAPQPGRRGLLRFVSRGRQKGGASANSRSGQGVPSEPDQAAASGSVVQPNTALQACPEDAECQTNGGQSGERQSAERMTSESLGTERQSAEEQSAERQSAERQSAKGHSAERPSAERQSAERLNTTGQSGERHTLPNPAESVEMQSASQTEAGRLSGVGQQTHWGADGPQGLRALSGEHLQQQLQGLTEAADQIRAACVHLQRQLQQQQQQQW